MKYSKILFIFLLSPLLPLACNQKSDSLSDGMAQSESSQNVLYVASGSCYAGGVTTSPAANTIATFDLITGQLRRVIIDYNMMSPGDSPVSIADYDATHLLVLVENASGRRLDVVAKDGSGAQVYLTNSTALSGTVRSMARLSDNSLLISKSSAIEKFSSGKSRILQGANPYVNTPGGSCATATTLFSSVVATSNSKILFAHSAVTPNNKIGLIAATGYSATGDCLTAQAAPTTVAMPTSLLIHSSGKLLAAYGSTTTSSNFIYAYDLNSAANTISNATQAYLDNGVINGPTAMAEDTSNGSVFIANGNSNFNTVEKFSFDSATKTLTRSPSVFLPSQIYTRCIADMKVLSR